MSVDYFSASNSKVIVDPAMDFTVKPQPAKRSPVKRSPCSFFHGMVAMPSRQQSHTKSASLTQLTPSSSSIILHLQSFSCAAARADASSEECCNLFFDSCAKRFHFSCCFGVSQTKASIFLPVFANFNDGFSTSLTLLKKNVTFVKDLGLN